MSPDERTAPTEHVGADAADWAALIRVHRGSVLLALLARGVRPGRARELVDDTWADLYERWCAGRLSSLELPGLAISHATFLALRDGARQQRAASFDDAADLLNATDHAASPEQRTVGRDLLERVATALNDCPPRARELFEAAYDNPDLAHAALAQRFGISVQRFRQALCEVRARLRRAVEEPE